MAVKVVTERRSAGTEPQPEDQNSNEAVEFVPPKAGNVELHLHDLEGVTREFIGELIVANASAIRKHTEEIGEAYNNPVIAMDKITQAHQELFEAMDTADRLKQEGISSARENIAKLNELSSEIQQRVGALPAPAELKSIEA